MNTKDKSWIKYFAHTVYMARDYRLSGRIEDAQRLDGIIEEYYLECQDAGYDEDELSQMESEIRNAKVSA